MSESADVFLVCELMMDFPCADYCEQLNVGNGPQPV